MHHITISTSQVYNAVRRIVRESRDICHFMGPQLQKVSIDQWPQACSSKQCMPANEKDNEGGSASPSVCERLHKGRRGQHGRG